MRTAADQFAVSPVSTLQRDEPLGTSTVLRTGPRPDRAMQVGYAEGTGTQAVKAIGSH